MTHNMPMQKLNLQLFKTISLSLFLLVCIYYVTKSLNITGEILSFSPGVAKAQTIYASLTPPGSGETAWVFEVWNILYGIANAFVAIILLFFAFVNIAHIQYDTYQLKKTLPKLILGIIMANFSIVICRLMLGISNVATATFMKDPKEMADGIMRAVCFTPNPEGGYAFGQGLMQAGSMFLIIIFGILILAGVVVIAVLLWIRRTMLYLLAAVSPIAFIMLAFPPTESYFKKWWEWEISWTFMGSISIFLIWVASKIGANQCGGTGAETFSFTALLATIGVLALAGIVPFKLGGPVMSAWGKLGGTAAKGAYNNPWAKADRARSGANWNRRWNNSMLGRSVNLARSKEEAWTKTREEENKGAMSEAYSRQSERDRALHQLRRRRAQGQTETQEAMEVELTTDIEAGENIRGLRRGLFGGRLFNDYRNNTGMRDPMQIARTYMNASKRLATAKSALEKRRNLDQGFASIRDIKDHNAVTGQMQADLGTGSGATFVQHAWAVAGVHGLALNRYDVDGTLSAAAGATGNNMFTYAETINAAADFRAKAKSASNQADRTTYDNIATEYENNARAYRQRNGNRYDYDAILDRNTSGRQYKEIIPRINEEAETTFNSSTGTSIISDLDRDHGTSEYRGNRNSADLALINRWNELDATSSFCEMQHFQAVMKFVAKGAQGDPEGIVAMNGIIDRVQQAHTRIGTGTVNVRATQMSRALSTMAPAQADDVVRGIPGGAAYANAAALTTAAAGGDATALGVLNGINLQHMVRDNTPEGRANDAFTRSLAMSIHENLIPGMDGSPGTPVGRARNNAHPRT